MDDEDFSEDDDEEGEQHTAVRRPKRFTHQDLYRQSHHHYLFEDIKKRRASLVVPAVNGSEAQCESVVGSRTRRQAAAANEKKTSSSASNSSPSTCGTIGRMNVGPSFQTPQLPLTFLEVQDCKLFHFIEREKDNEVQKCARKSLT